LHIGLRKLERDGLDGLSMSEVAAEAESSVGALYFRYGDKDQFVEAILTHALAESRDRMRALLDTAEIERWPIDRTIESWIGAMINGVRKRRSLLRIVLRQVLTRPEAMAPIQSFAIEVRERLITVLSSAEQVANKSDWQRNLRIASQIVHGVLMGMIVGEPKPLALDDDASKEQLTLAVLRYLGLDSTTIAARHVSRAEARVRRGKGAGVKGNAASRSPSTHRDCKPRKTTSPTRTQR
jgi:AcrR family transcriptional regulator